MITEFDETRRKWVTWVTLDEAKQFLDREDLFSVLRELNNVISMHNGEKATPAPNVIAIQFD